MARNSAAGMPTKISSVSMTLRPAPGSPPSSGCVAANAGVDESETSAVVTATVAVRRAVRAVTGKPY